MIIWTKQNGLTIRTNERPETIEHCEGLGWIREGEQPVELPIVEADKGSGVHGSAEWHTSAILGMDTKAKLIEYIKEAGIDCDTKGNLDAVKKKAIDSLRIEDDNSNTDSERSS